MYAKNWFIITDLNNIFQRKSFSNLGLFIRKE